MKLIEPTDQEVKDYASKKEESKIIIPKSKKLMNLDDQEYKRQISDVVKKWVLSKSESWQEKMRIIIDDKDNSNGELWHF